MPSPTIIGDRPKVAPATSAAGHEAFNLRVSRNTPRAASTVCARCITVMDATGPAASSASHRGG
ncbi:hypothetical protein [Myxococcus hansupus]|uniref:hypothetical protein n=1 Tax=Pseudomyxococcus hansupus TaxID=1297742 RepID=UPI001D03A871|nr:hypothetical protein [Myxococcus hansupus]